MYFLSRQFANFEPIFSFFWSCPGLQFCITIFSGISIIQVLVLQTFQGFQTVHVTLPAYAIRIPIRRRRQCKFCRIFEPSFSFFQVLKFNCNSILFLFMIFDYRKRCMCKKLRFESLYGDRRPCNFRGVRESQHKPIFSFFWSCSSIRFLSCFIHHILPKIPLS